MPDLPFRYFGWAEVRGCCHFMATTLLQKLRGHMKAIVSFRDLEVWNRGMDLIVSIYRITDAFPSRERFGLVSQIRRASVSIPSNVAEGHGRGEGSYLNHVRIAIGSEAELETEIEAAVRLGFVSEKAAAPIMSEMTELRRMLYGLRGSLERRRQAAISSGVLAVLIAFWWVAS